MGSKLALLLIAFIWLALAAVPIMARWNDAKAVSSVGQFRNQLFVLGRQCRTMNLNISITLQSATVTHFHEVSPGKLSRRAIARRRRTLLSLAGLTVLSLAAVPFAGLLATGTVVVTLFATCAYMALLVSTNPRRRQALPAARYSREHSMQLPSQHTGQLSASRR
jgi:hypothetical protein